MFNYKYFLFIYGLLLIYGCNSGKGRKNQADNKGKAAVAVNVSVASLQSFNNTIEANGNVLANEFVQLRPEMNGRVVFLNIPEGKMVSAGTLLLRLFDEDLKAQLRKYESQLDIAQKTEKRLKSLLAVNGLNQQEYDLALNQVNNLEADIDFVKSQLRKTEIRAPFSGVIGLRRVSEGAYVTPSDILATLQEVGQLKVDFVLQESHASAVKTGDEVDILAEDMTIHKAKVIGIEPLVNSTTRNIQVRAIILKANGNLRPGAFVKVSLDAAKGKKAILVPTNCIIPETRFKKIAVIKQGKVEMVTVETGYRGMDKVEVLSGLNQGDTFAISGILYLKPGTEVKINSVKP